VALLEDKASLFCTHPMTSDMLTGDPILAVST